jgi:hypothetical protein
MRPQPDVARDPEDRVIDERNERDVREKMLDKTIADSFLSSDPPSSIPDPDSDSFEREPARRSPSNPPASSYFPCKQNSPRQRGTLRVCHPLHRLRHRQRHPAQTPAQTATHGKVKSFCWVDPFRERVRRVVCHNFRYNVGSVCTGFL